MSLVRYNTQSSEVVDLKPIGSDNEDGDNQRNNRSLTVVYKNKNSNEIVLYDSNSKDFQIVRLAKPIDKNKRRYSERDAEIDHLDHKRRRSSSHGRTFICSNCGAFNSLSPSASPSSPSPSPSQSRSSSSSSLKRVVSPRNSINDNKLISLNNYEYGNFQFPYKFTETSSGDFISNDYFKLLTNSMYKGNDSLLTDGNGYEFHTIPENMINQGYFNKFFKILSKLGTGSYGSVYKVEHELLGLNLGIFALKKIAIGDDINNLKKILKEVKFLYNLSSNLLQNNNNVVKYNHVWVEIDQVSRFGPKIPVVFLLFEYCDGGTLEDWVDDLTNPKLNIEEEKFWRKSKAKPHMNISPRHLNNFEIFKIFKDITLGLDYLHDLNILHRDLKPSNCLFKSKFNKNYKFSPIANLKNLNEIPNLLVSDFGESIMVNSIDSDEIKSTGNTGTLEFVAPEIINNRKGINKEHFGGFSYSSDMYSLGMILYYLCFSKLPFSEDNLDSIDLSNEILSLKLFDDLYNLRPLISNIDDLNDGNELLIDWIDLIENLVSRDPTTRPNTKDILKSLKVIFEKLENDEENPELVITDDTGDKNNGNYNHNISDRDDDSITELTIDDEKQLPLDEDKDQVRMIYMMIVVSSTIAMFYMIRKRFYVDDNYTTIGINSQFLLIGLILGKRNILPIFVILEIFIFLITLIYMAYLYSI